MIPVSGPIAWIFWLLALAWTLGPYLMAWQLSRLAREYREAVHESELQKLLRELKLTQSLPAFHAPPPRN